MIWGWKSLSMTLMVGGFMMVSASASADDEMRARLETANEELVALEGDSRLAMESDEFAAARLEVVDAQASLAANDASRVSLLLTILETRLDYLKARLEEERLGELANERETEAFNMQLEADDLEIELETLRQQRRTLSTQLEGVLQEEAQ